MNECCCQKKKHRTSEEVKALINRLNRIEGQVRGIKNMLENDEYCVDILNQISASRAALSSLASVLLEDHIQTCVAEGIKNGDTEIISELTNTIKKFI
ncbi:MAG: metal-sensing transcriptional repressor [Ruminococcaceae bacterium]|nr:metal-sensing transcriptional repressor [Oscillospiraceae bacterium]